MSWWVVLAAWGFTAGVILYWWVGRDRELPHREVRWHPSQGPRPTTVTCRVCGFVGLPVDDEQAWGMVQEHAHNMDAVSQAERILNEEGS